MSSKELDRLAVVRQVLEGRLRQAKAAEFVGLSERQMRRLCAVFEKRGPAGLVSGKRGQPSNRRLPDELRSQAIEIVRERYADFGPTLACEKLLELHDLRVSKETLRVWLIGAGIWIPRRERVKMPHQPRHRRECFGEQDTLDRAPPQFVAYVLERATQSRVAPTRVLHGHAHQQADDRR